MKSRMWLAGTLLALLWTTPALAEDFYPRAHDIARTAAAMLGAEHRLPAPTPDNRRWHDVPDPTFTGPY